MCERGVGRGRHAFQSIVDCSWREQHPDEKLVVIDGKAKADIVARVSSIHNVANSC